jgi:putative endonuclease
MKISNPTARLGEDMAAAYLQKKGYKILERNFRKGYGELDIIATHKNCLVFIEVKTRTNDAYGTPLEAITPWKLREIIKTAQYYTLLHPRLPHLLRIDAIGVVLHNGDKRDTIEHVENISS